MAREGYLVNAGEETIHPDAQAPMSPKQKRQNWWYYNKFILLGVVCAVWRGLVRVYKKHVHTEARRGE